MSCRSSGGGAFHTLSPAAEKLLSPKMLWVRRTTQVLSLADCSRRRNVGLYYILLRWSMWGTSLPTTNYFQRRRGRALGAILEFWDSSPSLQQVKLETWNVVYGWNMSRIVLPTKNDHQWERGPGHVTDFEILGPPLSLEWLKIRTWNLMFAGRMWGTSLETANYPQKRRSIASGPVWEFVDPSTFSRTGEDRNLRFGVWMEYVIYYPPATNCHQREHDRDHVTIL